MTPEDRAAIEARDAALAPWKLVHGEWVGFRLLPVNGAAAQAESDRHKLLAALREAEAEAELQATWRTKAQESLRATEKAATFARDMIARWLYEEDDSGDDNDLADAYEALKEVLGPTTEEGLGKTLAARAALASTEEPKP